MSELPVPLTRGFSEENVLRIYHGEPAQVGENPPENLFGDRQLEAVVACADGLTLSEAAEVLDRSNVKDDTQDARNRLGVLDAFQLAGYFPLAADHDAIGGKKLAELKEVPHGLNILEAISVGKRNKQIAGQEGIKSRHIRERLTDIEAIWEDVEGALMLARVANAIRARYVQAIEAQPGTIVPGKHVIRMTLPVLAGMEARIHSEFPQARPSV